MTNVHQSHLHKVSFFQQGNTHNVTSIVSLKCEDVLIDTWLENTWLEWEKVSIYSDVENLQ